MKVTLSVVRLAIRRLRAQTVVLGRVPRDPQAVTTRGTVRFWLDEQGYGVIDSPETPGGCWTHFSEVAIAGYKSLKPGQPVLLEWETARQDGYLYRAVRTWPADRQPVDPVVDEAGTTGAYTSTVTITYDRDVPVEDEDAR